MKKGVWIFRDPSSWAELFLTYSSMNELPGDFFSEVGRTCLLELKIQISGLLLPAALIIAFLCLVVIFFIWAQFDLQKSSSVPCTWMNIASEGQLNSWEQWTQGTLPFFFKFRNSFRLYFEDDQNPLVSPSSCRLPAKCGIGFITLWDCWRRDSRRDGYLLPVIFLPCRWLVIYIYIYKKKI